MSDLRQWQNANNLYLATALAWLRERLAQLGAAQSIALPPQTAAATPPVPVVTTPPKSSSWTRVFRLGSPMSVSTPLLTIDGETTPTPTAAPASAIPLPSVMIDAESAPQPPALIMLARRLGLSEFERLTLLLCTAMELDTGFGELCDNVRANPAQRHPSFALAFTLFDRPAWDAMSPERPLRYWRLIEINQPGAQALIGSALKADERIVNYIKGLNYLDDRLAPLVTPMSADRGALPPSQLKVADAMVSSLQNATGGARAPVIQLLGADAASKHVVAQRVMDSLGMTLYQLSTEALSTQTADRETFARLWQRESALLPIALYIDTAELDRSNTAQTTALQRLLVHGLGVVLLASREPRPELGSAAFMFDVAKPTAREQQDAWHEVLGESAHDQPARLAGQFYFNLAVIRDIATRALAATADDPGALPDALWSACLRHSRPTLDQLAQPLEPKASWDDLELPATEKAALRQITLQIQNRAAVYDGWGFRQRMNRGLGISVLFAGESGTGKTMAAEVIANELQLGLYRIDLSAVVNKYIGETEKNLRRLFDAAEEGGAILFFDEADALFGKRSEVKDSHDRYANIEINYLLQRMEAYSGLAILATNLKGSLDSAFLRRLRFTVNFPFPGPIERIAIWRKAFPPETPTAELDFARLAKLNLTGASIHNIALNATFLAVQAEAPAVTMPNVLEAARGEFRKLEKPINETDFRWLEAAGGNT